MDERFHGPLKPQQLPRRTLLDLWERTVTAHERLSQVWWEAVSERHGANIADEIALEGWPLRNRGATPRKLFFDDLRFVVAATELQPEMLTVAPLDLAPMPEELVQDRGWFESFMKASKRLAPKPRPAASEPTWTSSPGRLKGRARGFGIDAGFWLMIKAWRASQRAVVRGMDLDAFETKVREQFDEKTLALLWNHAAIAYMLSTDRWYTGVRRRYGEEVAQKLEREVWIDRGAAEYDLSIGQQALGVEGNDIEALLRSFQFAPGEVGIIEVELELHGPNHGTLTHHRCPAVERLEHYDDSRLRHSCGICLAAMPISGGMVNPKIECKPLKIPPRRDSNDIACKWEYRLPVQS